MNPVIFKWLQGSVIALLISLCGSFLYNTVYSQSPLPPNQQEPAVILLTTTPSHTATPTPTGQTVPDLTITQIGGYVTGAPACSTGPYDLFYVAEITIANHGNQSAGAFTVTVNDLQQVVADGLAAGATTLVTFTSADGFSGGYVSATVDSANQVAESNENNNTLSGWIPLPTPVPTCTPGTPTPTATATPTWSGGCPGVGAASVAAPECTTTPTSTATPPGSNFNVVVGVTPGQTSLQVGDTITVLVTIDNRSIGCQYPVYNLTLSQQGTPIFRFDSPTVVGPPVFAQTVYTLTAISAGVATLQASAYGERNCGNGWQWTYVNGSSTQLTVGMAGVYTVTTTADSGPGSLRQLIADAAPGAKIEFAAALSGQTITLNTQLDVTKTLTIDGSTVAQPITLSGNNSVRVIFVGANVDVAISGLVIANGKVIQPITPPLLTPTPPLPPLGGISTGGGILNNGRLTLNKIVFANNLAGPGTMIAVAVMPPVSYGSGGALRNNGVVTITHSTFAGNRAINGYGGAVENYGQMLVRNSTFVNNYASHLGGAQGGALYNAATLTVYNSTFSTNSADGSYDDPRGSALYNQGTAWLYHNTFHGNTGSSLAAGGPTHLYNSLVANSVNGADCEGALTTNVTNLIEDGSCGATLTGDPKLGPLANNDGSTQTHLLLTGSPAIDAGDSVACLSTDQRGVVRPLDGNGDGVARCDIGAVEAPESSLIFADGFESGNLNTWSARAIDGGDLSVTRGAALVGRFGLSALLDDNNPLHVTDDRPNGEIGYQVRFRFDPNSLAMAHGDLHALFYGYVGTATQVLKLEMRFAAGQYQVRVAVRNDAAAWTNSAWFVISDAPHLLQLNWRAATAVGANNGRLAFRIDGVLKSNLLGIDNDTRRLDRVRLGALTGIDNGTRGTYFFDTFQANRIGGPSATAAEQEEPAEDTTAFVEAVTAEELADEAAEPPAQQLFLPLVTR